jgi:hypothetical protein
MMRRGIIWKIRWRVWEGYGPVSTAVHRIACRVGWHAISSWGVDGGRRVKLCGWCRRKFWRDSGSGLAA